MRPGVDTAEAVNATTDAAAGGMDLSSILGPVAGGGVGGGVIMAIIGAITHGISK